MPRTARNLADGGTYHVMCRGNNGQVVFHGDQDCQRYLQMLKLQLRTQPLRLWHFALMPNHVHLVLRADRGRALSLAMLRLNLTYSHYYRKRYEYSGHLWQGRFKSAAIPTETYLLECGRYVELNPVRAGLVDHPADYAWTSFRTYARGAEIPLLAQDQHPLYHSFGPTPQQRQSSYEQFVLGGLREDRAKRAAEHLAGVTLTRARRPQPMVIPSHDR